MKKLLTIDKKKKTITILSLTAVLFIASFTLLGFRYLHRFSLKEKTFIWELGKPKEGSATYIEGSKRVLEKTSLDISRVDADKEGTYQATASYDGEELSFQIQVKDTIAPEIVLNDNSQGMVGKEMAANAILKSTTDESGIKSIQFSSHQIEIKSTTPKDILSTVGVKFDKPGAQKLTVTVTDYNGNQSKEEVTIMVIEDYAAHVSGIQDMTVEQGATIDWMADVKKDDKITDIKVNADAVKMDVPGEYQLTYTIKGNDQKTMIEKTIKVIVVAPEQAQELANSGAQVNATGGVKEKVMAPEAGGESTRDDTYNASGGSYVPDNPSSGGNDYVPDNGSSGSGDSGGGSDFQPGQSWEGEKTGEGEIDPGGNTWEGGTWNPWG
ncbi:MAG: hypothetical protein RR869_08765 [Lachnospiraceae bacterium]